MNFLSFDSATKEVILAIRLMSSIPANKKIYSLCITGLPQVGKSFSLNALVIYLSRNGYLKYEVKDCDAVVNIFDSKSNDADSDGCNFIILYLRDGSEEWANSVIILFDFEGRGNNYLTISTQICSTLIFMSTNTWIDSAKSQLARMVEASMVQDSDRDTPICQNLRVILNKRENPIKPDMIQELYSKDSKTFDQSKEAINKAFDKIFPNRSIIGFKTKSNGFDNATNSEVLLYLNDLNDYFKDLVSTMLRPFSYHGTNLTSSTFSAYITNLVKYSNNNKSSFDRPIDYFDLVTICCQEKSEMCFISYKEHKYCPKVEMCTGDNKIRLQENHVKIKDITIDKYLNLTKEFIDSPEIREEHQNNLNSWITDYWNTILLDHDKKVQPLNKIISKFEEKRNFVIRLARILIEKFPKETADLIDLASKVSLYNDPIGSICTIKDFISNRKFEVITPAGRGDWKVEEVPAVMGTQFLSAVYTVKDVPVYRMRNVIRVVRDIPEETKAVRVCKGHIKTKTFMFQYNARSYYNSMESYFKHEANNGNIRDSTVSIELKRHCMSVCIVSWCKFCADDRCKSEIRSDTIEIPAIASLEEYVSEPESYVHSINKEFHLVTPERTVPCEIQAKSTIVLREIVPAVIDAYDLSQLCEVVDKWIAVASDYCHMKSITDIYE
uniref:Uncharacterized protein n=1 Tax=Chromulina nebulosa TaxID=96789 RepID=A0A7S0XFL7_9STRA|mmetsp:Transcript_91/g.83  ORF Transcript_91/g.83 Transcript_91/m.83 type:complete len:668 (+) Transcript_91:175-2178(+)